MKQCVDCKQLKDDQEFHKDSSRKDKLQTSCKGCKKLYFQKNKTRIRTVHRQYRANRYNTDIEFKLLTNLRNRLNMAIKNTQKVGSAIEDLGCTIPELKAHLEAQFQPGMTWENWGKNYGNWQIDHIKALCTFDLKNREEFLKANHYSNLQPIWYNEHTIKTQVDRSN